MSADPKITDTLMYGEGLCREQRTSTAFVWDDNWVAFGDQYGRFGEFGAKHVAVQFRRRPKRVRHICDSPLGPILVKELEDA